MTLKQLSALFFLFLLVFSKQGFPVDSGRHNPFRSGSYQQILEDNEGQPFVLVIWSKDCSSCLQDMEILQEIHRDLPGCKFVLLATDDLASIDEVDRIIDQMSLTDLESWIFAEDNAQKLRYEIDPRWYGELPRTYFFNRTHQREGYSGTLSKQQFLDRISIIRQKEPD